MEMQVPLLTSFSATEFQSVKSMKNAQSDIDTGFKTSVSLRMNISFVNIPTNFLRFTSIRNEWVTSTSCISVVMRLHRQANPQSQCKGSTCARLDHVQHARLSIVMASTWTQMQKSRHWIVSTSFLPVFRVNFTVPPSSGESPANPPSDKLQVMNRWNHIHFSMENINTDVSRIQINRQQQQ